MAVFGEDLEILKKDIFQYEKGLLREKSIRKDNENIIHNLKEELKISVENEKRRFQEIKDKNILLSIQNKTINQLLNATEENLNLKEQLKIFKKSNQELKETRGHETQNYKIEIDKLKLYYNAELTKLKKQGEEREKNITKEMDFLKEEFDKRIRTLKEEIINLRLEKEEENNVTVLLYEEKLNALEGELKQSKEKLNQCQISCSSAIESYQKHIEIIERNKKSPQLPTSPKTTKEHFPNRFKPLPLMVTTYSNEIRKPLLCSPSQCENSNINIQEQIVQNLLHKKNLHIEEIKKNNEFNPPPKTKKRKLFTNSEFESLPFVDD